MLSARPYPHKLRAVRECGRWIAMPLLALGLAPPASSEPAAPPTAGDRVVVERVVWPIQVREKRVARERGVCDRLTATDILVEEDGAKLSVTAVEKRLVPLTHALLIDTSSSMLAQDRLARAKRSAIRYVRQLPADEPVLVAAFDDSMVLIVPPELDRERLARAIGGIGPGNWTALWDAVYEMVRYLESMPGHKALLVLTDGEDFTSLSRIDAPPVVELFRERPDISVFPVGIDLARAGSERGKRVRATLASLARTTGGLYHQSQGHSGFDEIFDHIRSHLEQRQFVIYEPRPLDARPVEERSGEERRWREVDVRVRPGLPCRVRSAVPPSRRVGEPDPGTIKSRRAFSGDLSQRIASLGGCPELPSEPRVAIELGSPPSRGWPRSGAAAPAVWVLDPPGPLVGHTPDVLLERGVLYRHKVYEARGRYRLITDRRPEIASRDIGVDIPPLDELRRTLGRPEEVVLRMLQRGACAQDPPRPGRPPILVHGKTFFELRPLIGRALYEFYPDYRRWAVGRLVQEAALAAERLLQGLERDARPTPARRAALRKSVLESATSRETEAPLRLLAEWLGDVAARDLALRLDIYLANLLLDDGARDDRRGFAARLCKSGWGQLRAWFPPATQVRVLTPLVPAYDAERDVIGFYRVILPRPDVENAGPPSDPVPEAPFAVLTIRWLLAAPERPPLELRVESVRQDPPPRGERNQLEHRLAGGGEPIRVVLELGAPGAGPGDLSLTAYYSGHDARQPRAVSACSRQGSTAGATLARWLAARDEYVPLPCPSEGRGSES